VFLVFGINRVLMSFSYDETAPRTTRAGLSAAGNSEVQRDDT
jgi:hypothetical protein